MANQTYSLYPSLLEQPGYDETISKLKRTLASIMVFFSKRSKPVPECKNVNLQEFES